MTGKHFSNTGQILQLIVAVLGVVIAGKNAYPSIEAKELLAVWPVVFYLFVLIAAIVLVLPLRSPSAISTDSSAETAVDGKPSPKPLPTVEAKPLPTANAKPLPISRISEFSNRMPEGAIRVDAEAGTFCFRMKPGERRIIGTDMDRQTLEFHGLDQLLDGEIAADISVSSFLDIMQGGRRVNEKARQRFLIPRAGGSQTNFSLFSAVGSTDYIDINIIGVDHINEHTGEVDLTIIRCWGRAQGKDMVL